MVIFSKKFLALLIGTLLVMGCDLFSDGKDDSKKVEPAVVKDTNITKADAILLSAYNVVTSVNFDDIDVSDFYKINLKSGDIAKYTNSANTTISFEGSCDTTVPGEITATADGVIYIELTYLDDQDGTFTLSAYDPVLTEGLKTNLSRHSSAGSTIDYEEDLSGNLIVRSDMSSDPDPYPYAKLSRFIIGDDGLGNPVTLVDITDLESLVVSYISTHEIRFTFKDDETDLGAGFSYHLPATATMKTVEIKVTDLVLDSWAATNRTLDINNVFEFTMGITENVAGEFTLYQFDAL